MRIERWEVDSSHSSVHFSVRHLVIAKVRGTFSRWSGTVQVPDGDFSKATVDVTIDAAVLAVKHSFLVDNFGCGAPLGTVHIKGSLAQKFRGRLAGSGTSSGGVTSGYLKDYQYDDRFKYRSPPFFLSPVVSAWHIVRENEQVPAR